MKIGVTGSRGYLGSVVKDHLSAQGHEVFELIRAHHSRDDNAVIPFDLSSGIESGAIQHLDAIVHCAYDFSARDWSGIYNSNVLGTQRLVEAAQKAGIERFVFISSISAYSGCRSLYGRAKLMGEEIVKKAGGTSIRPALIYGKNPGGMVGSLRNIVKKLPIVPVMGANCPMYLCYDQDLARIIEHTVLDKTTESLFTAAHPQSFRFIEIVQLLAQSQNKRPMLVNIPWQLAYAGLKTFETIGLKLGFRSDSLLGLAYPCPEPNFSEYKQKIPESSSFSHFLNGPTT